jgi:hypothetical protein
MKDEGRRMKNIRRAAPLTRLTSSFFLYPSYFFLSAVIPAGL